MSKKQMLIVDDNTNLREALKMVFEDSYELTFAASGEEALQTSETKTPHVVLMDFNLPGLTGVQTMHLLRDQAPDSQVVIMSAYDDRPTVTAALRCGAFDFVSKPFSLEEIRSTVQQAAISAEKVIQFRKTERTTMQPENFVSQSELNQMIDQTLQVACVY